MPIGGGGTNIIELHIPIKSSTFAKRKKRRIYYHQKLYITYGKEE